MPVVTQLPSEPPSTRLKFCPTRVQVIGVVPAPTDLVGQQTPEGVSFTWTNPDPQAGDTFDWNRSDLGPDQPVTRVREPTVTVPGVQKACVEVVIVRDNGSATASAVNACVGY